MRNEIYIIPLRDIHLYSHYQNEAEVNGNGQTVSFLFLIAFFIIGIAWINYVNLVTVRSIERAKEVGIRKVFGSRQSDLIKQFLFESFIINFIAFLLAIGCVFIITPWFNQHIGRVKQNGFFLPVKYWLGLDAMFLSGSLLSGIYPAFILSRYNPVIVLKGVFKSSNRGIFLRKALIVVQFTTSIILISGTIIIYQQVNYMLKQNLGVNINQTIVLNGAQSVSDSLYQNSYQPFKTELLKIPSIKNITASTTPIGKAIFYENSAYQPGFIYKSLTIKILYIDHDFIPAFKLKIRAGRNFSKNFETNRKAILLNEEAAKLLGFNDYSKAINEFVISGIDTLKIIGIVANYHQEGLQKTIEPIMFCLWPNCNNYYFIKIESHNIPVTIAAIKKAWMQYFPNDPFNYFFLAEYFNQQYKGDELFGKVFGFFAMLAIIIASFGLTGLFGYNILQRSKEISIRRVLGASAFNILIILSKDFLLLVTLSFAIAIPLASWIMYKWLKNFAYRINIHWWVYFFTGTTVLLLTLVIIIFQSLRIILISPAKNLGTE